MGAGDFREIERALLRWMRWGLFAPAIAGVVLCALAVALFVLDGSFRAHEAFLIVMLGVGGLLILGAATVAAWRPDGFASYLRTHSELVEAAVAEIEANEARRGDVRDLARRDGD